jgi:predicted dienelactone hydrolase
MWYPCSEAPGEIDLGKVPLQLWAWEHGGDGVSPASVAAVARSLPARNEYHVVPNAGHFAFLIPCPPALAKYRPEVCTDAPGFDRVAFYKQFNADVLVFFRTHLMQVLSQRRSRWGN